MGVGYRMTAGALALALGVSGSALAADDVNLELSLSVDASGSISSGEFALQMNGYSAAFLNSDVQASIAAAPKGVAVNVVFFASSATEGLPFQILRTEADATAFANALAGLAAPKPGGIGFGTDIRDGINLSTSTIFNNNITSDTQIIDVSGDGVASATNTAGARDAALAAGIDVINGLAVGDGLDPQFFTDNVIGGNGAQTFVASTFQDFERVVTQKIKFEIDQGGGGNPDPDPDPGTIIPSPTAAFAGMALLGVVGARRRRSA